jgi:peroxiredoxin
MATPDAMMDKTPDAMMDATPGAMMDKTPDAMMGATPEAMMEMPGWFTASLTNATTGETFKMQDFKGKVVLVETMAMWCPTCLSQQKEIKALHDQLGMHSDLASIGIDVDINENLASLKDYTAKNGFDWTFTVADAAVAREIGQLYGQQFLNPPSAPMFIVDRHGEVHPLPFGVKSATDLQKALEPFLNETM